MSCCSVKCYTNQNENLLLNQIPKCLKNLSYGVYPNNKNYNDKRFIYNKLFNYYPLAIFYPNNENDVSYLIKQFIKYDVKFTIRCGGHAYEPASLSESYIIDVSKITRIDVNRKEKYVCVGSGVKLGNLINELKQYKLITPTGESSCVGLSGLVLAGGKGFLSRVIGMASDSIISLKIVNPEENYDEFCKCTFHNDSVRAISNFFTELVRYNILSIDNIVNLINILQIKLILKGKENTPDENPCIEFSENIYILISKCLKQLVKHDNWNNILQNII